MTGSPIVSAMAKAVADSMSLLRERFRVIGYGPIVDGSGTVLYTVDGVEFRTPEPTEYCWAAMSTSQQLTWCMKYHLSGHCVETRK